MRGLPLAERFPQGPACSYPWIAEGRALSPGALQFCMEPQGWEGLGVMGGPSVKEGGVFALTGVQVRTLSTNERNSPQTRGLLRAPPLFLALGGLRQG